MAEGLIPPWYVLTGGPSAGKTTLLNTLESAGYRTVSEAARAYIEKHLASGETLAEIRSDEGAFQRALVEMKISIEKNLPKDEPLFFDRGMHDSAAYYEFTGIPEDELLQDAMRASKYRKVFLLALLPYQEDGIRSESAADAERLNVLLKKHYEKHSIAVLDVPVMPVGKRAEFVLSNL